MNRFCACMFGSTLFVFLFWLLPSNLPLLSRIKPRIYPSADSSRGYLCHLP